MNFRFVARQLGVILAALSVLMGGLGVFALITSRLGDASEAAAVAPFLGSAASGIALGVVLVLAARLWTQGEGVSDLRLKTGHMGRRDALLLVALGWIAGAALAGLPYLLWAHHLGEAGAGHPFRSPVNCYFEGMSGLSTTGATILDDVTTLPRSLLLWRAATQWLGGLGIIVLFVAVLPLVGASGKRLFRIESTGSIPGGVRPQIRETARTLWLVYFGLTALVLGLLMLAGLDWFEATCHAMTTLATGGFSTRNESIGGFGSPLVNAIVIAFMILAGTNFGLYCAAIRGRVSSIWQDTEFRCYIGLLALGALIISTSLLIRAEPLFGTDGGVMAPTLATAVNHSVFTTVAMGTGTGYSSNDFNAWPFSAKVVIIALMFIGGSAGSTTGGIKVMRIWIALRVMLAEIERAFRPKVVRPLRIGGTTIDPDLKLGTIAYVLSVILIFFVGAALLMVLEAGSGQCDFKTASAASLATLSTVGPGFGGIGPVQNYGWFSDPSKILLCLLMALGRLEIFTIAVLFTPRFWRGT